MDFQEADRRYAELKAQYTSGALSADQMDAQLREMMVQDDKGQWWAKSRESGDWSYYDGTNWVRATPPGAGVGQPTTQVSTGQGGAQIYDTPASTEKFDTAAQPNAYGGGQTGASGMGGGYSPPAGGGYNPQAGGGYNPSQGQGAPGPQGYGQPAQPPQGGYNPQMGYGQNPPPGGGYQQPPMGMSGDKPVDQNLAIVFYLISFFVPIAALVLFIVYRSKPFPSDQQLAKVCGIIGLVSFGLYFFCVCALPILSSIGRRY